MQARQYAPEEGRFLGQDVFASAGADLQLQTDPLTQNRYVFAGGNPVSNIEWDGHKGVCSSTMSATECRQWIRDYGEMKEEAFEERQAAAAADSAELRSDLRAAMSGESDQPALDPTAPVELDFTSPPSGSLSDEEQLEAAVLYDEIFGLSKRQEERLSEDGRLGTCPAGYSNYAICSEPGLIDTWEDLTVVTGGLGGSLLRGGRGAIGGLFGGGASRAGDIGIREVARRWLLSRTTVGARGGGKPPWTSWENYSKVTVGGREYAQVGDRLYTRHAVERTMPRGLTTEGRSISPNYVEDVIQTGARSDITVGGVPRQTFRSGTVEVVTEQGGRVVVTVNPYKYK